MKLVVLMSIEEHSRQLRNMMSEHKIPVFSGADIEGYKTTDKHELETSWFAGATPGIFSHLYFAFVEQEKSTELLDAIEKYNNAHHGANPLRAYELNVERGV